MRVNEKKEGKEKKKKGYYFIILIVKGFLSALIGKVLCTGSSMISGLLAGFLVLQGAACGCQVCRNLGQLGRLCMKNVENIKLFNLLFNEWGLSIMYVCVLLIYLFIISFNFFYM
jgi:hypothetical protein